MSKFNTIFENVMQSVDTQIEQEMPIFTVENLIEELQKDEQLLVKYSPRYKEYKISFAPFQFRKSYDRNKDCPGWVIYNIAKKIWINQNTNIRWEDVPIHVYAEYAIID
jgi:hypothetical protein